MPLDIFKNPLVQHWVKSGITNSSVKQELYNEKITDNLQGSSLLGGEDEGYNEHYANDLADKTYLENALGENQEFTSIFTWGKNAASALGNGISSAANILAPMLKQTSFLATDLARDLTPEIAYQDSTEDLNIPKTEYDNIYYSPKDDHLGKNFSEWGAELSYTLAESAPLMVVGSGVGAAVTRTTSLLAGVTGRVLGRAAVNNLGYLARVSTALENPMISEQIGALAGGFATSRAIGEFNARDTQKDTYTESFNTQLENYKNNLRQQNPFATEQEIANSLDPKIIEGFQNEALKQGEEAADTVRSLSWATGLLNVTSSLKVLGGSLTSKSGSLLFGASRSTPFAKGYWNQFSKELALEMGQESVEELFEGASQNYAKNKALAGKGGSNLVTGLGDSDLWKNLYDLTFSNEGRDTIILSALSGGVMQGAGGIRDTVTGEVSEHNKKHANWKTNSASLIGFKNDLNSLSKAKSEEEVVKIKQNINKNAFLKNLRGDSLNSSISTKLSQLAEEKGLNDISGLLSQTDFATQIHSAFSLGLGDVVQDTLDALGSQDNFDLLHQMTGTTPSREDTSKMKEKLSELKSIAKLSEKVFNETSNKYGQNPAHAKSIYDKKVAKILAEKELLVQNIATQEKLKSAIKEVNMDQMLNHPEIQAEHRKVSTDLGLGKAQEFLQEKFLENSTDTKVQDYQKQKSKQAGLESAISKLGEDIDILEKLDPTKDSKGTVHPSPQEAQQSDEKIVVEEKKTAETISKNEGKTEDKVYAEKEKLLEEIQELEIILAESDGYEDFDPAMLDDYASVLEEKKKSLQIIEDEIVKRTATNPQITNEAVESTEDFRIKSDIDSAKMALDTIFGDSLKDLNIEIICK